MPNHVCHGAMLKCTMGMAPSSLVVLPIKLVNTSNVPANPMVAAATAAAMGVLTPMPCIPVTPAPWTPGSPTVTLANQPALNKSSMLMCNWAGQISIEMEGQMTHAIP